MFVLIQKKYHRNNNKKYTKKPVDTDWIVKKYPRKKKGCKWGNSCKHPEERKWEFMERPKVEYYLEWIEDTPDKKDNKPDPPISDTIDIS